MKDVGGDEFFQFYALARRTAGAADRRQEPQPVRCVESRRRADRVFVDAAQRHRHRPLRHESARSEATIGGSRSARAAAGPSPDFSPRRVAGAMVLECVSVTKSNLWLLDLATGALTPIGDHAKAIAYGGAQVRPGRHALGHLGRRFGLPAARHARRASGRFTPRAPETRWDVEDFDIAPDGTLRRLQRQRRRPQRAAHPRPSPPAPCARRSAADGHDRRHRGCALGRDRLHVHLGAQSGGRLLGRSEDAGRHALDDAARPADSTRAATSSPNWSR